MAIFPSQLSYFAKYRGRCFDENPMGGEVLDKRIGEILTTIISPKDTNRGLKHIKN